MQPVELEYFRSRLQRARQRFTDFGQTWAEYLTERPHRLIVDVHEAGNGQVRIERDIPIPNVLSLILGEFLYHLRAALDNCLYGVAVLESGQSPPPNAERLEWPICLTPEAWRRSSSRLSALSEDVRTALETIQPYQAEYPDWNCLRLLHDMARIDRHRALHLVTLASSPDEPKEDLLWRNS